jgi:hypothetical protein
VRQTIEAIHAWRKEQRQVTEPFPLRPPAQPVLAQVPEVAS